MMDCPNCKAKLVCDDCYEYTTYEWRIPRCEKCKKRYEKEVEEAKSELVTLHQSEHQKFSKQIAAYEDRQKKHADRLVFLRLGDADPANEALKGDVALVIHGTELIYAHRFVLAGKLPVFCRMFDCGMLEKKTGMVPIDDASLPVMRAMVKYCYTADISFTDEVPADEVLQVAHKYEINHLGNVCEDELCQRINEKNVPKMLRLGKKFNARALQDAAAKYFKDHFDAVVPAVLEDL